LRKHNRGEASSAVDPDFAEALEEGGRERDSASRRAEYKTRQLCRQVQRALNLVLAERGLDLGLEELYVDDVTPAAGCGRLLVHFVAPPDLLLSDVLAGLASIAPRLRAEVARAISRKRAPELSFIPVARAGGCDG
jgi:ribosome-binding factor A